VADGRTGDGVDQGFSRRDLLVSGATAGAAIAVDGAFASPASAGRIKPEGWGKSAPRSSRFRFDGPDGPGWRRGWRSIGVANLRREGGLGLLEAGSDVFPNDPRPVAFLTDHRSRDCELTATIALVGSAPGVVLRRAAPDRYYAAILDTEAGSLKIVIRHGVALDELASVPVAALAAPITLALQAAGATPTSLRATVADAAGRTAEVLATDRTRGLQRPGDPGVLALADTLFPSDGNPVLPALGNLHLLPWSVQEGQAIMDTAVGQSVIDEIRRRSTAGFSEIAVSSRRRPRRTKPAVVAAFTGPLVRGGARLHVAADIAARASFEVSTSPSFTDSRIVAAGRTGRFHAAARTVTGLPAGRRVYWRAHLERHGRRSKGPVRSFRNGPARAADGSLRIAVAACGSQFGPIFDHLAEREPDVLVWHGDLNYPDTHGPLAQTMSGYAGIWRDFLANPRLAATLQRCSFAPQRDDHDYGIQDANSLTIPSRPWALAPWDALMNRRTFYRFPAGAAEVWVLDQRRFKSDPESPDGPDKTLLGSRQREWLLRTLAASEARFKIICSPTTVFMAANARDGNWATGYEAERDLVLTHIRRRVGGTPVFLTGDTHLTGVFESGGEYEVRAAPVGIPKPNDITLVDPLAAQKLRRRDGVVYAGDECHFTLLELHGRGRRARLDLSLVREDGEVPYSRSF
jgi:hypothetical protein